MTNYKDMENMVEQRIARWENTGLLEGLENDHEKAVVATLLDNQKSYMESAQDSSTVLPIANYAFPMVRRIYPNLIAKQLVATQPLTMPTGKVFFLDFIYGTDQAPVKKGDRMDLLTNQAYPGENLNKAVNYTRGYVRGEVVAIGDGSTTLFRTKIAPFNMNGNVGIRVDAVAVTPIYSGNPVAGQVLVDPEAGILVFGTAPAAGASVTADYDVRLEGDNSRIPEINLEMSEDGLSVGTRKLKARWTIEAQQDLRAYHGIDAEAELTAAASREIGLEIDREIINDLLAGAGSNINWSKTYAGASAGYPTRRDYDETLLHALLEADALIFNKRMRKSSWIITGPDVGIRLEKMNSFRFMGDGFNGGGVAAGPYMSGSLSNRWNIIIDPLFPRDKILVGYKGGQFFDTGYIYAPYVPLMITPTFMDPNDFTPRRGMMTRYGKKMVSGDFYVTVTLVP